MTPVRTSAAVIFVFVLLTGVVTWPAVLTLGTRAVQHADVYFNMWRLAWFAHATITPAHLWDANIFYPEHHTFALSDAMPVEGALAAPLFWLSVRPVLIHNVMLFGAMALSGAAMFVLAAHVTASRGAGLLAGIVFAFAPYRFEHAMHMELQWAMWTPLALWALHRTIETGSVKYGVATGAFVALQMLSCVYYGVFLATLLPIVGGLLLIRNRAAPLRRTVLSLGAGVLLSAGVCGLYAIPYGYAHAMVGDRAYAEVIAFSARPSSYLVASADNRVYGQMFQERGRMERRLFPGILVVLLAAIGLLLRRPSNTAIVYAIALAVAFDMSLGIGGYSYAFLYRYVGVFKGLRAPARLGLFVAMFLAILAAYGYEAMARGWARSLRYAAVAALAVGMILEYRVALALEPFPNAAPGLYRALREQPRGVVMEFPAAVPRTLPGDDPEYAYESTFHWFPLANGYSGTYPPSYLRRLERVRGFPDDRSLRQLASDSVRYVIVHESLYQPAELARVIERIDRTGRFVQLGSFPDREDVRSVGILYRFR